MKELALRWLKDIEKYLASGDGDRDLKDEDRKVIAHLTHRCQETLVEEQGWLERHNQRVIDGEG
jgi:hypothetical protein